MKTEFTLKKIISYLLMFTVVLGLVQSENIHIAKADTTTVSADRTFIDQVIIKANGTDTLTVDKRSDGVFICDTINMGTNNFTIEGNTGNNYTVTNVVSTGKDD